jgi:ABC-type phosphate transport system substrate-binding protein
VKIKKIIAMSTIAGVALAGLAFSSANAEPVSNSYALVGSDTLQDSTNALTNGTTASGAFVRLTPNLTSVGNFDAFGSATIQTKSNGPFFTRPSGSGAGVNALIASITGNPYGVTANNPGKVITGQVDIARSSSGPGANTNVNGRLLYVPYARDAVAYAYKGGNAAWASLTVEQLKEIYSGTPTTIGGVLVKPRLPQAGSGTRSFFLGALGLGSATPVVPDAGNTTAENDASILGDNEIIPFSVASWVAQANGVTGTNTTNLAGVAMGTPLGATVPFTGTAPNLVPDATFYANGTFGRDTYLVVERARVMPGATYDAGLANLVDSTSATSLTNFGSLAASPGAVKKKFGFLAPSTTTQIRAYAF